MEGTDTANNRKVSYATQQKREEAIRENKRRYYWKKK
jgi:hypothetical protein